MLSIKECAEGKSCPYLGGLEVYSLQKDWEYLKTRVLDLEMKLARLEKENQGLRQEKEALQYELKQALEKIFKSPLRHRPLENRPQPRCTCWASRWWS